MNLISKAKVTYEGLIKGRKYIEFIQKCHIGLSTQEPSAAFNATSFPSKVLSYLANGLRVVSIRIAAITNSSIGSLLTYYDSQSPENIAKTIASVDLSSAYDSRIIIIKLSDQFISDIRSLINSFE